MKTAIITPLNTNRSYTAEVPEHYTHNIVWLSQKSWFSDGVAVSITLDNTTQIFTR